MNQRLKLIPKLVKDSKLKGLYRGLSPNFFGATGAWSLYFYLYTHYKSIIGNNKQKLEPFEHLLASALGGASTTLFTNPIFVVKTRMMTQNNRDSHAYKGLIDGISRIGREEGIKGLYRGIIPALFGVSHGALQFMVYEQAKMYQQEYPQTLVPKSIELLILASVSKIFASVCTYPYQVVKARMQTESRLLLENYNGVGDTIKSITKKEGIRGFYKGMGINIVRVLPGTCITFGVYELVTAISHKYGSEI